MDKRDRNALDKCIRELDDGIMISLEVKPNASSTGFEAIDPWRACIQVRIKSQARKGRANKELVTYLSSVLSVPKSNISIVGGTKSPRKTVRILRCSRSDIMENLVPAFESRRKISNEYEE